MKLKNTWKKNVINIFFKFENERHIGICNVYFSLHKNSTLMWL